jgi:hypothetical protein
LALKKPKRPKNKPHFKPKALCKYPSPVLLGNVVAAVRYEPSRYHCPGPNGEHPLPRLKPGTPCTRKWSIAQATIALKHSINAGWVSDKWNEDFPRFVWYRDGDGTIYEARSEVGTPYRYHAYPVEIFEVPKALHW